jgi:hypothetical protein
MTTMAMNITNGTVGQTANLATITSVLTRATAAYHATCIMARNSSDIRTARSAGDTQSYAGHSAARGEHCFTRQEAKCAKGPGTYHAAPRTE